MDGAESLKALWSNDVMWRLSKTVTLRTSSCTHSVVEVVLKVSL